MSAPIQPVFTQRGEAQTIEITVTRRSDGTPVNLDTEISALEMEISTAAGTTPTVLLSIGSGITLQAQSGTTLGKADIVVNNVQNDLVPAIYSYDVIMVLATSGHRKHVIPPSPWHVAASVNEV